MMCIAKDKQQFESKSKALFEQLSRIETLLEKQCMSDSGYFNGNAPSMIDFSFAPLLQRLLYIENDYLKSLFDAAPLLKNWAINLLSLEAVNKATPENLHQKIRQRINSENGVLAPKHENNFIN